MSLVFKILVLFSSPRVILGQRQSQIDEVTVGYLPSIVGSLFNDHDRIPHAVTLAINDLNNRSDILSGVNLKVKMEDTGGDSMRATKILTKMLCDDVAAFFGPEIGCTVEAAVAASWNRSMISHNCKDSAVSDKAKYPTFARTNAPDSQIVKSVLALFNEYNWTTFSIVVDGSLWNEAQFIMLAESLKTTASSRGMTPSNIFKIDNKFNFDSQTWSDIFESTRIFVYLGETSNLLKMMAAMQKQGLFDYGEYLVVYIDLVIYNYYEADKYVWEYADIRSSPHNTTQDGVFDTHCRNFLKFKISAAQSLLVVAPTQTNYTILQKFARRIELTDADDTSSVTFIIRDLQVIQLAVNLYDSVFLYAQALHNIWGDKTNYSLLQHKARDGIEIIKAITKMGSYESVTGARVIVDENGDSEGNFTLIAYKPHNYNGGLIKCDHYMIPIGNFQPILPINTRQSSKASQKLQLFPGVKIDWVGGKPPVDSPICGFGNEKCMFTKKTYEISYELVAILSTVGILILIGVIVLIVYFRKRYQKILLRGLTDFQIDQFKHGCGIENGDFGADVQSMPYNTDYEIPQNALKVIGGSILGSGVFGIVIKGILELPGCGPRTVAVKALKEMADSTHLRALLAEIKVMIYVGHSCPFVVSLVGACTSELSIGKAYILIEMCENGSLENYLRRNRTFYKNDGQNLKDLIQLSFEIASGMEYLSSKKIIHGDLATRNVLLNADNRAKISDFGLSKHLYEDLNYIRKNKIALPWRWMSIEALRDMTFSTESDIWSYGVTLWEVFSLAETPYPGLNYGSEFINKLKDGQRLAYPPYATDNIYLKMVKCWNLDPNHRPSFAELKIFFSSMTMNSNLDMEENTRQSDSNELEHREVIQYIQ